MESIIETGKDPETPKDFPAGSDLTPSSTITPAEPDTPRADTAALYLASAPIRTLFARAREPGETLEELKGTVQPGKRKMLRDEDEVAGKRGKDADSSYDGCLVCYRLYEEGDNMIQCDGLCKGWYHIECVDLSYEEFERIPQDEEWVCECCLNGIHPHRIRKSIGN